jgi:4-amino-4-deoxy-L-arabinose transferase-like glycosyltransferase
LVKLGYGSLASWDEAIYGTSARELSRSSNWLDLTYGGIPWFDKPPLNMWVTAFFYKLFGIGEFSVRLFSALCGIGTVLVTYLFASRLFSRWIGFLSALVLVSSSHYLHFARFGQLDSPLTFFISSALYFFWMGRERNRYFIFSGIALGLAVMTKGPAGFFIIFISWIYALSAGEAHLLGRPNYWIGLMVAAGIALPWNLYQLVTHQSGFISDAIRMHLVSRTTTAMDGHVGNYYFYIRTLVNKYHPWILVGVVSAPYFLFKSIKTRYEEFILPTVWMFFVFVTFTLVKTKLAWYIIPAYPALSISVGYFLAKLFKEEHKNWIKAAFIGVMILHVPYSHIWNHDYSRGIKAIAPAVSQIVPKEEPVYLYEYHEMPAALFYFDRKAGGVDYIDTEDALVSKAQGSKNFFILVQDRNLSDLQDSLKKLMLQPAATQEGLTLFFRKG